MQNTITLREDSALDLNDFDIETEVSFRLNTVNKTYDVGKGDRVFTTITQNPVFATYNVEIKQLKKEEYDRLIVILNTLKVNLNAFPFNDFSDNYLFSWSLNEAEEKGAVLKVLGTVDQWQIVKQYRYDNHTGYRFVPYIPAEATVQLFLNGVATSIGGVGDIQLDRNNGVFFDNVAKDLESATEIDVVCDLFYIYTTFVGDVVVNTYYDYGQNIETGIGLPVDNRQLWSVSFQLREEVFNRPLDIDLNPVPSAPSLTEFPLNNKVAGLTQSFKSRVEEFTHHGMNFRRDLGVLGVDNTITIPEDTLKHSDLHFWIALFRATQGGGFELV